MTFPGVTGDSIVLSRDDTIETYDLATGAKRRSVQIPHVAMYTSATAIVLIDAVEEFALDPMTLAPTWRVPRPDGVHLAGGWVVETPSVKQPVLRLRRASDGVVVAEIAGELEHFWFGGPFLASDQLVIQLDSGLENKPTYLVVDAATGNVRFRGTGVVRAVSGGRIVVAESGIHPQPQRIVGLDGRELFHVDGTDLVLHDDTAYASTDHDITAIDLISNHILWRTPLAGRAFTADASWLYAWASERELVAIDRRTGEIGGSIPTSFVAGSSTPPFERGAAVWLDHYLLGYGTLAAPEPSSSIEVRACFTIAGCPPNSAQLVGATVTLGNVTATTDRHGCLHARTTAGLSPVALRTSGGTMAREPAILDNEFPGAVILDGAPLSLLALYIGGGCHDSRPGQFP